MLPKAPGEDAGSGARRADDEDWGVGECHVWRPVSPNTAASGIGKNTHNGWKARAGRDAHNFVIALMSYGSGGFRLTKTELERLTPARRARIRLQGPPPHSLARLLLRRSSAEREAPTRPV